MLTTGRLFVLYFNVLFLLKNYVASAEITKRIGIAAGFFCQEILHTGCRGLLATSREQCNRLCLFYIAGLAQFLRSKQVEG
ncbi:MAG: hypothetical protein ACJASY_004238 [Halioglobus sp.]